MKAGRTPNNDDPRPGSRSAMIIGRAPLPIVEVQGSAHKVSHVNSAFCRLLGKSREDLIGKSFADIVHGGDQCMPILDRVYQTGEAATHELEDQSQALTESVLDGILIVSLEGRMIHFNQRFLKIWNFPSSVLEKKSDEAALQWAAGQTADPATFLAGVTAAYLTPDKETREELLMADGRVYERCGSPVHLGGAPLGWVWTFRDMTERRAFMENLRFAKEQAESASLTKDDFLAALSHELRTPLTPVLMTATALETDPALPPEVRDQLAMMRRNIELEARLIDDLLDLTRISHGKLTITPVVTDVHELLNHTAEIILIDRLGKDVSIVFKQEAVRHHTLADPARLQQVFWNLIKNAIKFTPSGGSIAVSTRSDAVGRIILSVADSGVGISAESLPHIFKAFEQGDVAGQHR